EFDALCDWSADCEPPSSLEVSHPQPVLPSEPVWPAFWDWLFDWVEEFQLPAFADAVDPLDWSVEPELSRATFGDRLSEPLPAFASWLTELSAACDGSIVCVSDPPGPPGPRASAEPRPIVSASASAATRAVK